MKEKGWLPGSICWLISILGCYAQPTRVVSFGLTGGGNAGLIKNQGGNKTILWRYNIGLTAEGRLAETIRLTGQLIYSQQGEHVTLRSYSVFTGNTTEEQFIHFDYINLPLILCIQPKGEWVFIQAGAQVGYLIGNRLYEASRPGQVRRVEYTQPVDIGLTGGLGYRLGKHLVVDVRYYYGLKSILEDYTQVVPLTGGLTLAGNDKWYNRVLSVNLSCYFR